MHEGHRQRLTERLLREGLEGSAEHEILEYLLFHVIPRADTNAVANRLIGAFGSLSGVLEADVKDLERTEGIGRRAAAYLTMFPELFRAYERSKLKKRPCIKSLKDACAFARSLLFGKPYEQFYVIWLDTQGRVIHYERLSEGDMQEAPVNIGKLAAGAIRHRAVKGIVAHNHPGGDVTPSGADISATHDIRSALGTLGIELIDHIIIGDGAALSFRADSLIDSGGDKSKDAYAAEYSGLK